MIKVLAKADDILSKVALGGGMNFSCLQRVTGINKSTLSQIMKTLAELEWVKRDEAGIFKPGERLEGFARRAVGRESLGRALTAAVDRLADSSGALASASVLMGTERVRVACREGAGELLVDEGRADPGRGILNTATGKLLFAFQDAARRGEIMKAEGIRETRAISAEVEKIRKTGTARNVTSSGLVKSLAKGVFGRDGDIAAAIGVALPASLCSPELESRYEAMVYDAAAFAKRLINL